MTQSEKIWEYIQEKEKYTIIWTLDSIKSEFDSLVWKEEKETWDWLKLFEWLKNDKNLLTYAELKNKEESKLSGWDKLKMNLLELKLSITCPYFSDFKDFLEELKKWEYIPQPWESWNTWDSSQWNENIETTETTEKIDGSENTELVKHNTFLGVNIDSIVSSPYYKNSQTGVTWCSKTARENWKRFWLVLPSWDAYNAWEKPWQDCLFTLPADKVNEKPKKKWKKIELTEFILSNKWNYADMYVESWSNYGHRASAFKDDAGQWYVLDPYTRVNGRLDTSPKKLEDYAKTKKILKVHFYESKWYVPDSQEVAENPQVEKAVQWAISIAEDNCYGYERWWKWKNWNYDCSWLVNAAFKQAGFNIQNKMGTQSMKEEYEALWFEWITPYNPNNLKRWDIVLKNKWADWERHTEIYTWNWKFVWARSNYDKKSWDSSWKEISETSANWLTNYWWNWVLRYKW